MTLLERVFTKLRPSIASEGSDAAAHAMKVSSELLQRMREHSRSDDPARALMADIWSQRHNVPFITTVYEAAQEMNVPLAQNSGKSANVEFKR
jgi:hypothetical protein